MRSLLAVLVPLLLLLAGCGGSSGGAITGVQEFDDDGYAGVLLDPPYAVPSVPLESTEGGTLDLAAQERRTLVFFGYTSCPDICSTVMSTIASGLARLSDAERDRLQVVFVSTDPARDTLPALEKYLARFDPSFIGARGTLAQVDELGRPMDVHVSRGTELPSGGYEVDHSTHVISIAGGEGDLLWTGATSPAEISGDLEKVLAP